MTDAFMGIYAGVGGAEALEFVEVLFRMYQSFCARQGWRIELFSAIEGTPRGMEAVEFFVHGQGALDRLDEEAGVHRRIREDERNKRLAAFVSVYVMIPEDASLLDEAELRIETFSEVTSVGEHKEHSSGAVRITHEPTGIIVETTGGADPLQRSRALQVMATKLSNRNATAEVDTLPGNLRRRYDFNVEPRTIKDVVWETLSTDVEEILNGDLSRLEPQAKDPQGAPP